MKKIGIVSAVEMCGPGVEKKNYKMPGDELIYIKKLQIDVYDTQTGKMISVNPIFNRNSFYMLGSIVTYDEESNTVLGLRMNITDEDYQDLTQVYFAYITMREDLKRKRKDGLTTIIEKLRVLPTSPKKGSENLTALFEQAIDIMTLCAAQIENISLILFGFTNNFKLAQFMNQLNMPKKTKTMISKEEYSDYLSRNYYKTVLEVLSEGIIGDEIPTDRHIKIGTNRTKLGQFLGANICPLDENYGGKDYIKIGLTGEQLADYFCSEQYQRAITEYGFPKTIGEIASVIRKNSSLGDIRFLDQVKSKNPYMYIGERIIDTSR